MSGGKFWAHNSKAAKLSAGQVMEMRARYRQGGITQGRLSTEYKVSVIQVGRILRGEVWQDIPELPDNKEEQAAVLARLLVVQRETTRDRMANDIAKAKAKERAGDNYLNELIGDPNGTGTKGGTE